MWFGETRFVAADIAESTFTDAWLSGCVLAGVRRSPRLRRVTFRGCKLDSVNFRDATLTDSFEDCVLRDPDFATAKLTRVGFPAAPSAATFTKATCSSVDLRGAFFTPAADPRRLRLRCAALDRLAAAHGHGPAARPPPGHRGQGLTRAPQLSPRGRDVRHPSPLLRSPLLQSHQHHPPTLRTFQRHISVYIGHRSGQKVRKVATGRTQSDPEAVPEGLVVVEVTV